MIIKVACKCGKRFAAQPDLAGKRIKCPSCGLPMSAPKPSLEIATSSYQSFAIQKPHLVFDCWSRDSRSFYLFVVSNFWITVIARLKLCAVARLRRNAHGMK
jgi:hypothetical protein